MRPSKADDPLAQLVEHNTFNVGVLGSSPKRITKVRLSEMKASFLFNSHNVAGIQQAAPFLEQRCEPQKGLTVTGMPQPPARQVTAQPSVFAGPFPSFATASMHSNARKAMPRHGLRAGKGAQAG